jgi:hypothetical protein
MDRVEGRNAVDGLQVAQFTFNAVRYEIDIRKTGGTQPVSYLFTVDVEGGKPIIIGHKWTTEPLGVVSDELVIRAVRNAIDALI